MEDFKGLNEKYGTFKMIDPLVSIVVPCFNHEKYIKECINSIIDQDYYNIELIIIDDGSRDNSADVIQKLVPACLKRFRKFEFRSRPNKGLCETLNEALEWCSGELYSAIASDDVLLPHKTTRQVKHLTENPKCDCVFGGVNIIDDNSKLIRKKKSRPGEFGFKEIFLAKRSLAAPTQMVRTSYLRDAGGYSDNFYVEDWYMWLRLASIGAKFCDIGEVLANYRWHDNSSSLSFDDMRLSRRRIIDMYKDNYLYSRACAGSELSAAIDIQTVSKVASLKYLRSAISESLSIIFDKKFARYIVKLMIPSQWIGRNRR